ncbi:phage/plasmid primase, P4 family [Sporolactobacillus sp. CQH2019]|uniref:DNA primase family protein n=1 Tax=Sporolactobacillus sp. CQH2019 TaxID=3023512 RepID=UPI0023684974|nr:phage/plasmid primase, P4 family [Sporolactobacillus sp. CQH2019]MDD9147369.1 phage/plasmid primase, P4 family [Sporolactobacillus sp. CQH2019]
MPAAVTELNRKRIENNDPQNYFKGNRYIPKRLGKEIVNTYEHIFFDGKKLYIYRNGKYLSKGELVLKKLIQDLLDEESNTNRIKQTMDWIKNETQILEDTKINPDDGIINVNNGLLNYQTGELKPHSPKRLSTIQLPVNYDPNADDPKMMAFIKSIVPDDAVPVLLEFLGYCLMPNCRYQKALLCTGSGANGKSTFFNLIEKIIGRENISSVSLQDLDNNRFKVAQLYGKLINIFADIPKTPIKEASNFKTIVTGDSINAEFKGIDSFDFKPFTKLIFSANEIPETSEKNEGFYRRWIIIPFPNQFKDKNCDPLIEQKLSTNEALSTLFNLAIAGLNRLEHNEAFSPSDSIEDAINAYRGIRNSIDDFIEEKCLLSEIHTYSTADLHNEYITYCNNLQIKPIGTKKFNERLKSKYSLSKGRKHGQSEHWQGIKLK